MSIFASYKRSHITSITVAGLLLVAASFEACTTSTTAAATIKVAMMGDSTTLSMQSPPGSKLVDRVQARLDDLFQGQGSTVQVINAGVSGDTIEGGLARLETDALAYAPDVVTLSFGLNDVGQSPYYGKTYYTADYFQQCMENAVTKICAEAPTAKILLVTSTPFDDARHFWANMPFFTDQGGLDEYLNSEFLARTRFVAAEMNVALCDLHAVFRAGFANDPTLINSTILPDGVHLTDAGNDWAASVLRPQIHGLLAPEPGTLGLLGCGLAALLGWSLCRVWQKRK